MLPEGRRPRLWHQAWGKPRCSVEGGSEIVMATCLRCVGEPRCGGRGQQPGQCSGPLASGIWISGQSPGVTGFAHAREHCLAGRVRAPSSSAVLVTCTKGVKFQGQLLCLLVTSHCLSTVRGSLYVEMHYRRMPACLSRPRVTGLPLHARQVVYIVFLPKALTNVPRRGSGSAGVGRKSRATSYRRPPG